MDDLTAARLSNLSTALARAARRWRDKVALSYGERTWTFEQLNDAASRIAVQLTAAGIAPGDRVAAYGKNSDAYLLGFLACCRAGVIHVPINFALKGQELLYILQQSGSSAVLFDTDMEADLTRVVGELGDLHSVPFETGERSLLTMALGSDAPQESPGADTEIAQIMYTSGTTSAPKGAAMSHQAVLMQYASCVHDLDFAPEDRVLAALPLYHTAQMHAFTMPQLLTGAYTRLLKAPEPATVLELIETEKLTSFFAPPTVWISLLRHPDFDSRDLASLTKIYYGAAIMPEPVLEELRARLPQAGTFNVYGQTEIAPVATVLRPEEHLERPTSAGRPVLFVETRVVDEDMQDVPAGELGEIVHRSPQLLSSYWEKPEETAEAFRGGWFHSGDLGRFDDEGYLYIIDRIKDVVNTGGVLVASREVEDAVFSHPAVSEVAVVALPDEKWIEAVTAIIVLRDGCTATAEDVLTHAKERLAGYKVPKKIVFIDELPKNASGKILKRELRTRFGS